MPFGFFSTALFLHRLFLDRPSFFLHAPPPPVITYNILCDAYTTDRSFPPATNPAAHLAWAGREPRLVEELAGYGADLLFLQEVQEDAWGEGEGEQAARTDALGPALRAHGYEGAWFWSVPPPPGVAVSSLKPRKGPPRVGPALLARSARFQVLALAALPFRDARCAPGLAGGHAPTAALLAGGRDGAVAALLADRVSGARLLAASAHVNWDYRTPDLKVLQVAALLDELRRFGESAAGGGGAAGGTPPPTLPLPLILGGDFNSLPVERAANAAPGAPSCDGVPSGAYALLTRGRLDPGHPHHPARQRGGSPGVTFTTAGWGPLASARAAAAEDGAEPALTTRTTEFEGTLDYIFVSPAHWRVAGVLEDPWPAGEAAAAGGGGGAGVSGGEAGAPPQAPPPPLAAFPPTPNLAWPSDHLAVGAVVEPRAPEVALL